MRAGAGAVRHLLHPELMASWAARRGATDRALVVGGCRDGRRGNEVTPLWQAADDGLVETAQLLLLGGVGGRGGHSKEE